MEDGDGANGWMEVVDIIEDDRNTEQHTGKHYSGLRKVIKSLFFSRGDKTFLYRRLGRPIRSLSAGLLRSMQMS